MRTVPAHVYFVAFVFALSTLHVSQEVGLAMAAQETNTRLYPVATSHIDAARTIESKRLQVFSDEDFLRQKNQVAQMSAVLKKVELRIAALNKRGIPTPPALLQQLDTTKAAIASVKNASSSNNEDVQSAIYTLRQSGESLRKEMQRFELLAQTPRMLKQAQTEIKNLELRLARSEKKVDLTSDSTSPAAESLAELRQSVAFIKSGLAHAQEQFTNGDIESSMSTLRLDVWDQLSTAGRLAATVEGLTQETNTKIDYSVFSDS